MRLMFGLILLMLGASAPALSQTLDWSDGGAIQMPSVDLDGDTFPAGTAVRCPVFVGATQVAVVNSTVGATFQIGRTLVPKGTTAGQTATATAACTTPLNTTEAGATDSRLVLLRPPGFRGAGSPTLQP
jgi:hypothetical protein